MLLPVEKDIDIHSPEQIVYTNPQNHLNVHATTPLVKAVFADLAEAWPQTRPFASLLPAASQRLGMDRLQNSDRVQSDINELGKTLLQCYVNGMLEFHVIPSRISITQSEKPIASNVARVQASNGKLATNLRHEFVQLNDIGLQILQRLDGKHDSKSMCATITHLIEQDILTLSCDTAEDRNQVIAEAVVESLQRLRKQAFFKE